MSTFSKSAKLMEAPAMPGAAYQTQLSAVSYQLSAAHAPTAQHEDHDDTKTTKKLLVIFVSSYLRVHRVHPSGRKVIVSARRAVIHR
jgi:hypothetical protein